MGVSRLEAKEVRCGSGLEARGPDEKKRDHDAFPVHIHRPISPKEGSRCKSRVKGLKVWVWMWQKKYILLGRKNLMEDKEWIGLFLLLHSPGSQNMEHFHLYLERALTLFPEHHTNLP